MKVVSSCWAFCARVISRLARDEKGASAIEYVLIAAVVVAAVSLISGNIENAVSAAGDKLEQQVSAASSTIGS
ncbi:MULTISPECIES: Flp family type IVb pilin [Photobacterium]|uniref:Flp family type IVb pilin n=1 Tax=Photobacterium TaxID=657 RepID=UPI000A890341|nr:MULTISPECIES: Flp family type IVb pilin [Photobacterium]MBV1840647.1 Flp family type IVb pilin [Photobacterium ganghwense]QSV14989.1 Flp family type IVb pilin [Photobacterium ganghwense]